jgi:hypothetical protein
MDLTPGLMELAEQLPAAEAMGLSLQLRQIMVALPGSIGNDLVNGGNSRFKPMFKLIATLELIDRVYPALDTTGAKTSADKLAEHLSGSDFDQATAAPTLAAPSVPEAAEPPEPAPTPEPTHVQVQAAAPEVTVETDVQPNSVQ